MHLGLLEALDHLLVGVLEVVQHLLLSFVIGLQTIDLVQEDLPLFSQVGILVFILLHPELHFLDLILDFLPGLILPVTLEGLDLLLQGLIGLAHLVEGFLVLREEALVLILLGGELSLELGVLLGQSVVVLYDLLTLLLHLLHLCLDLDQHLILLNIDAVVAGKGRILAIVQLGGVHHPLPRVQEAAPSVQLDRSVLGLLMDVRVHRCVLEIRLVMVMEVVALFIREALSIEHNVILGHLELCLGLAVANEVSLGWLILVLTVDALVPH
mmetsp:Transcript_16442/g.15757  ORF Transcript_16442/g.15757 Transcript_16442/m.15757 type:complete len:269 (+) Transcript_16442:1636-2442(+)